MQKNKTNDLSNQIKETYQIIVECENEKDLKELYDRLTEEGYQCQVLIL
jgi:hypothetical protein